MHLAFLLDDEPLLSRCRYQQKSPIILASKRPWYHPSMTDISWWNLSPCSSLTLPRLGEKNPSGNAESAFLKTYELLIAHMLSACYQPYQHIVHDGDFQRS